MAQLHLVKQSQGILIPATQETSDFLQSKCKLGAVLEADYKLVRNPAFHRRYFALLNLGFDYWEPTGGAISSNERRLVCGYAKFLAAYGGNESALLDAAEQYLDRIAEKRAGSISFASMDETEFQELYKASLDVLWWWILSRSFNSPLEVENAANQLLSFAG